MFASVGWTDNTLAQLALLTQVAQASAAARLLNSKRKNSRWKV